MDRTASYPIEHRTALEALLNRLRGALAGCIHRNTMPVVGPHLQYDIGLRDLRPSRKENLDAVGPFWAAPSGRF